MQWRRLGDIALVAWMIIVSLYFAGNLPDPFELWRSLDLVGAVLIVGIHLPLLLRRTYPAAALVAVCIAAAAYLWFGYYHSVITFAIALAVYSVTSLRPRRIAIACSLLGMAVLVYAQRLTEQGMGVFGGAVAAIVIVLAWAFGDGTRKLQERSERLAMLTGRLRREQEKLTRQAVSQEQSRIARELHDVVAHHMSVISVQAGLGRYVLESDPATTRAALDVIADTAHDSLNEMRRLLSVLRAAAQDNDTQDAPYDAAPALKSLPDLIERVRAAGATVDLRVTGTPVPLTPGLELCAYRVVQESLTNVLKHADPPIATIAFEWRAGELTIHVTDEGRPRPQGTYDSDIVRHGLIGMRERARIYGGTLTVGKRPVAGFEVCLTLPTGERNT